MDELSISASPRPGAEEAQAVAHFRLCSPFSVLARVMLDRPSSHALGIVGYLCGDSWFLQLMIKVMPRGTASQPTFEAWNMANSWV